MTTETLTPHHDDVQPGSARTHSRRAIIVLVLAVLVLGGVLVQRAVGHPDDIRSDTTLVDVDGMAARYGIEVSLIAVTAAGGLIEFRYRVVDPDKADSLVHSDDDLLPVMVDEESGVTLRMASPPHHHSIQTELGGTYFFLMANAHNALHEGSVVTLVIGDARMEHLEVQG